MSQRTAPKVCRVCLSSDLQLHRISSPLLQIFYETIAHVKLNNGASELLCYLCVGLLKKCCMFAGTVRKANTLLEKFSYGQQYPLKSLHKYSTTAVDIQTYIQNSCSDTEECGKKDIKSESNITGHYNTHQDNLQNDNEHNILIEKDFDHIESFDDMKLEHTNDQNDTIYEAEYIDEENNDIIDEIQNINDQNDDTIDQNRDENSQTTFSLPNIEKSDNTTKFRKKLININLTKSIHVNSKRKINKKNITENEKVLLSCDKCDYKHSSIGYINQHKTRVHSETILCPICKQKINDTEINKHITENHKEMNIIKVNLLSCTLCNKYKCLKESQLKKHIMAHNCVKCKFCEYISSKTDIDKHLLKHGQEKEFFSDKCDHKSDVNIELKHKMDKHGTIDKLIICLMCDFQCIDNQQLTNHLLKHANENVCIDCEEEFQDILKLHEHLTVHDKTILCKKCNYICSNKIKLSNHNKVHSKKFKCDYSVETFDAKNNLKQHTTKHTGNNTYVCKKCDYKTHSAHRLKTHSFKHTDSKSYTCPECNSTHKSEQQLKRHIKDIHKIYTHRYSCSKCHYKCSRLPQLKLHNKLSHQIIPTYRKKPGEKWICDYCGFNTTKKCELERHIYIHTQYNPYTCSECSLKFKCKYYLKKHKQIKHVYDKKICPNCKLQVQNPTELQIHLNKCLKKFLCDICGSKWKNSLLLRRHIMIHTGEKPFACKVCSYKSSTESDMVKHNRTHTNDKPYACDKCSYRCAFSGNLLRHLSSHSTAKPFSCHICDAKYKTKKDLKKHVNRLHGCPDKL